MAKTNFQSVDEYIAAQPAEAQGVLKRVRSILQRALPGAEEGISYQIPTYKEHGKAVIHLAAWKHHYSLYPASEEVVATFAEELAPLEVSKGTIRFPLGEPVPAKLIAGIAKVRAKEVGGSAAARPAARRGKKPAPGASEHDDPAAVTAYLATLAPPLGDVVKAIRSAVLGAAPGITEGIKWNSASFYCHGWFATVNVRDSDAVRVVLHLGAKVRRGAALGRSLGDAGGLLKWMSEDRAVVTFDGLEDFEARRGAFAAVVRQWAAHQREIAGAG